MSNRSRAKQFAAKLKKEVMVDLREKTSAMLDGVADETVSDIKDYTPFLTGTLRNGWKVIKVRFERIIYNEVPYAEKVEFGPSGGFMRLNTLPIVMEERGKKYWGKD